MKKSQPHQPASLKFWIITSLLVLANAALVASFWPFVVRAVRHRADQLVVEAKRGQGSEAQLNFKIAQILDPGNQLAAATVAGSLLAQEQPERALDVLTKAAAHGAGESSDMQAISIKALLETNSTNRAVARADDLATHAATSQQLQAVALAYTVGERTDRLASQAARLAASEAARRVVAAAPSKLALAQELYAVGLLRSSQRMLEPLPASLVRQLLLGRLYEHTGSPTALAQARDAYAAATNLDPTSVEAREGLIRALNATGDKAAANQQTELLKRLQDGRP